MRCRSICLVGAILLIAPLSLLRSLAAADKSAAELLPASVVAYVEVPRPGRVIDLVLDHPLSEAIQRQPDIERSWQRPAQQRLLATVKRVEERFGLPWREAAKSLSDGGLYFGFDLTSQGVAGLARAENEALASKALETLLNLARSEAERRGASDRIQEEELRGVTVYTLGEAHVAALGPWLVVTNKKVLMHLVIENHLSAGEALASDEQFRAVHGSRGEQAAAWMYLDLRVVREMGLLKAALRDKSDNPAVELLAGGVIGTLPQAKYVTAALELDAQRLALVAAVPCDTAAVAKTRAFYFGPEGDGEAPPAIEVPGTILSLATYRDFASLWRHAPDLFNEGVNAKFAEAESNLTTFFAGRNFRDEILGNLQPGMQLVVARQEFPQGGVTPAIKLPGVAAVFRMKQPEETARIFKITFQSAVGFINVVGAMNGAEPLEQNTEQRGEALVVSTQYLPPRKVEDMDEAAIQYNASPTVAFVGDRFIIASSRVLAEALVEQPRDKPAAESPRPSAERINTQVHLDGQAVHAALADNRGALIDQNMLDKGHERAAAEKEIDGVLAVLSNVEQVGLRLATDERLLRLSLELVLKDAR